MVISSNEGGYGVWGATSFRDRYNVSFIVMFCTPAVVCTDQMFQYRYLEEFDSILSVADLFRCSSNIYWMVSVRYYLLIECCVVVADLDIYSPISTWVVCIRVFYPLALPSNVSCLVVIGC